MARDLDLHLTAGVHIQQTPHRIVEFLSPPFPEFERAAEDEAHMQTRLFISPQFAPGCL